MSEITFKATRATSRSCSTYRAIEKKGDLKYDIANTSDDVIIIYPNRDNPRITIDCNKATGEFSIKFDEGAQTFD